MERLISLVGPQMSSCDKTELGSGLGLEQGLELEDPRSDDGRQSSDVRGVEEQFGGGRWTVRK